MTPRRFTELAELAGQRYLLLVEGWRGIYARLLLGADFGTPRAIARAQTEAYRIARAYLGTERNLVTETTREIVAGALAHASVPRSAVTGSDDNEDAPSAHVSELQHYLEREIGAQIERDIAFMRRAVQRATMETTWIATATGVPARTAMLQWRLADGGELRFYFKDRAGRRWPSQKFIRSVWRQHLLDIFNETVLTVLAARGETLAQAVHVDFNSASHGRRFSLIPGGSLPTYGEIRDEVFHANADAVVAPLQESV